MPDLAGPYDVSNEIAGKKPFKIPLPSESAINTFAGELGGIGAALGGNTPAGQLGLFAQAQAQRQAYSDLVSGLLAGQDISTLDTTILDPDQITAALDILDRTNKTKQAAQRTNADVEESAARAKDIPAGRATEERKLDVTEAGQTLNATLTREEIAARKSIAAADRIAQQTIAAERNLSAESMAVLDNATKLKLSKEGAEAELKLVKAREAAFMNQLKAEYGDKQGAKAALGLIQTMLGSGVYSYNQIKSVSAQLLNPYQMLPEEVPGGAYRPTETDLLYSDETPAGSEFDQYNY